ncbi:MAG: transglycosylase domain-containing protein [Caldilineaceae bacterium]
MEQSPLPLLSTPIADSPIAATELYLAQSQVGTMPHVFQSTLILDRHGELIAELFGEGRRTWVPLSALSSNLISATLATEDASFFNNVGIDAPRIVVATLRNLQRGQIISGASTITMQLARNLFFTPEQRLDQSLQRKIQEAQLATDLTKLYSKEAILEMYLNLLNYGNLAYGPEAAAQVYFGKSASNLDMAEATLLAGLPQAPALLDPFRNFSAVKERQRVVLDLLVRHKQLSQEEADAIFDEPLALRSDAGAPINRAPHFVQYILEQLSDQIGNSDLQTVLDAGLRITTTLDLHIQALAQKAVSETVARLASASNMSNAALVALKPNSGEILAMVGSADFNNDAIDGQVNVSVRLRQPGSAIKPLFYATALEDNLISPATVLWDIPVSYTVDLNKVYIPTNYDGRFHGPVTVRTALANSYNIPAVKLVDAVGVERMLEGARQLGVKSLNKPTNWYGLSLTLGGGEVTLLDLTSGFHTLASAGRYLPPQAILAAESGWGQSIAISQPFAVQAISPQSAFLISDILSDNTARTPAFGSNSPLHLSRPAAAKTGTTTDFKDNWTIGFTRFLVAGVWAGNNDGQPMRNTSGVTGAAPIWNAFMESVLADAEALATLGVPGDDAAWNFAAPEGVELRTECPVGVSCRRNGEYFNRRWIDKAGANGPLADSVEFAPSAPVFVQQGDQTRRAGYCLLPNGAVRPVLKVRDHLGLPDPTSTALTGAPDSLISDELITDTDPFNAFAVEVPEVVEPTPTPSLADFGETPRLSNNELGQIVAWALRYSAPVDLGRCDDLQTRLPQAFIGTEADEQAAMRVLVDTVNPSEELTGTVPADAQAIGDIQTIGLPTPTPDGMQFIAAANLYMPTSAPIHDQSCSGQYVMGHVMNQSGALVAGVHLHLRDQWGNQYDAISKDSSGDTGAYDFPIYSSSPHELYLTVVDGNGTPLSPTVTIPHLLRESEGKPCHRIDFVGG